MFQHFCLILCAHCQISRLPIQVMKNLSFLQYFFCDFVKKYSSILHINRRIRKTAPSKYADRIANNLFLFFRKPPKTILPTRNCFKSSLTPTKTRQKMRKTRIMKTIIIGMKRHLEERHEKTCFLNMRKQRCRSAVW